MNLRKVLALAKKRKHFIENVNEEGDRFVNVGGAWYLIDALPVMTNEEAEIITGIDNEKGIVLTGDKIELKKLNNYCEGDLFLEKNINTKLYRNETLFNACEINEKLYFYDNEFFEPFKGDTNIEFLARKLRVKTGKETYLLLIKTGMVLNAAILPYEFNDALQDIKEDIEKYNEAFKQMVLTGEVENETDTY